MTTTTHILVDFENVQPSAADIGLVRGDGLRLAIFRGPGQMKYAADVAEAWQPLGANLTFIRCAKAGRNAVDMHIAFYLGELIATQPPQAAAKGVRFVVVSRDSDFDPLLLHIRNQGFDATRVKSIQEALAGATTRAEPRAPKPRSARSGAAPVAKKAAAKKVAKKAPAAKTPPGAGSNADAHSKVIDSLQRMGQKRPGKRKGLERHIESHLGRNLAPGALQTLIGELERDGVLAFNDNKVEYRLPKHKK
jgi:hypothetical protein